MVRTEVIQIAEPDALALEALRQYAAVSDAGQDNVLTLALKRAFDMVQRAADVALLPGTFRVCASDHPRTVNVYMG
jgi:predicted ATP-dependent protease